MTNKIYIVAGERNMELAALRGAGLYVNVGQTTRDVEDRLRDDDYKRKAAGGKWKVIFQQDVGELTDKDIHPILKKHPRIYWDPDSNNTEEFLFVDDPGDGSVAKKTVIEILTPYCPPLLKKENDNLRDRISALEEEIGSITSLAGSQGIDLQKIQEIEQENERLKDSLNMSNRLLAVEKDESASLKGSIQQYENKLNEANEFNRRWISRSGNFESECLKLKESLRQAELKVQEMNNENASLRKDLQESNNISDRMQVGAELVLKRARDTEELVRNLETERSKLQKRIQGYEKESLESFSILVAASVASVISAAAAGIIFWIHLQLPRNAPIVAAAENSSSPIALAVPAPPAYAEPISPEESSLLLTTPESTPKAKAENTVVERMMADREVPTAAEVAGTKLAEAEEKKAEEDAEYAPVEPAAPPPPSTKPVPRDPFYTKADLFIKFENCIYNQTATSWNNIVDIMKCNSGNDLKMRACLMVPHGRNWVSGIADLAHASDCWKRNH